MADFPAAPVNGQTFTSVDGTVWTWADTSWRSEGWGGGGGTSSITVSDYPPSSAKANSDLWWNSNTGVLKIYYSDGDSIQWVDASKAGGGGSGAGVDLITIYNSIDVASNASITYTDSVFADANGAWAQRFIELQANYTNLSNGISSKANITYVDQVVANASGASATSMQNYVAQYVADHPSGNAINLASYATVSYVTSAIANANGAIATAYQNYVAQYVADHPSGGDLSSYATVSYVTSAISGAGFASASSVSTLSSTVGGHTSSISSITSSVNGISAKYGVTIDNNGAVSGFQLLSGSGGSAFIVAADSFKVNKTGLTTPLTIFDVDTGTQKVKFNANVDISGSLTVSAASVNTAINGGVTSGARVTIDATNGGRIRIYDGSGVLRVQLGYLG